jgi:hypothetical protein
VEARCLVVHCTMLVDSLVCSEVSRGWALDTDTGYKGLFFLYTLWEEKKKFTLILIKRNMRDTRTDDTHELMIHK